MTCFLTVLLILGLSLDPRTTMLEGTLHALTIWAEPDSVAPWGVPLTIWCQGTFDALEYSLSKEGSTPFLYQQTSPGLGKKVNFTIPSVTGNHAGQYYCESVSLCGLIVRSDTLELVVTGAYSKPILLVLSSSVVTSGVNMTIQCDSGLGFDRFVLIKEVEHTPSRTLFSQNISHGKFRALFHVGLAPSSQRWTFRCYGNYRNTPYLWSESSDPFKIMSDSQSQNHTVENLGRMGIAGLVLVVLGILLVEAWHSQRRTQDEARR